MKYILRWLSSNLKNKILHIANKIKQPAIHKPISTVFISINASKMSAINSTIFSNAKHGYLIIEPIKSDTNGIHDVAINNKPPQIITSNKPAHIKFAIGDTIEIVPKVAKTTGKVKITAQIDCKIGVKIALAIFRALLKGLNEPRINRIIGIYKTIIPNVAQTESKKPVLIAAYGFNITIIAHESPNEFMVSEK